MKLKRRVGIKLFEMSQALLGRRGDRRGGSSESAPPYTGPGFIAALSKIPTVYRCATVKANDKARVPLLIGRRKGEEFKALNPGDEIAKLFATINPVEGPVAFWARSYQMQQLTGDLLIQIERLKGRRPQELWLMQSDRTTILKGAARRPRGYEYGRDVDVVTLPPEDVFHTKLPNAGDDWRGLSPLAASEVFAWLQERMGWNNVQLIHQGGVPRGFISFDEHVEREDRDELRTELSRRTNGENAHKIGLLWDGAKWIPTGITPRDGEFPFLSDEAKEMICSCFGVPPVYVMNLKQAKYDNMLQQKEMYWFSTLIPELELCAQDLTAWLRMEYGDETLEARYDYEKVEAIQDLRLVRAEAVQGLFRGGLLSRNEARAEMGRPRATGSDYFLDPQTLVIGGTAPASQAPKAMPAHRKIWIDDPSRHAKRAESERDMASFVPEVERSVVAHETRVESIIRAGFEKAGEPRTKEDEDTIDWDAIEAETEAMLVRAYAKVVGARGQAAVDEVIEDDIFDLSIPGVSDWIETTAGEKGKLITGTLKEQLREEFAASSAAGESSAEFSQRIGDLFDLRRSEANRIAWTETASAYNFGTLEGFRQSEVVEKKEWLTAGDSLVREAHMEADGQVVGLEEMFLVDGELLEFPGGPGGSAENVINCRCAMQPVIDESAKASKMARRKMGVTVTAKDLDELFAAPLRNGIAK